MVRNKLPEGPELCPVCGEDVSRRSLACPECGADHNSEWLEDTYGGVAAHKGILEPLWGMLDIEEGTEYDPINDETNNMKFTLLEETIKVDSANDEKSVMKREETTERIEAGGQGVFLIAVNKSFTDSGFGVTVGTLTTTRTHYVTCKELGFERREVLVSYAAISDGSEIYKITLQ